MSKMNAASLQVGSVFAGDYRIVKPLSAGGMGMVYVAHQLSTGRDRALKIMLGELAGNADLTRRFVQEAKIGAQIESEHIVEVVGAGVDAETQTPWLAMELLQGVDLSEHLQRSGPLPAAFVLDLFEQLTHALGAAHDKQIVHRDLKPENLFLANARRAGGSFTLKILDFGIAKLMNHVRTSATGAMGTPLWMAPEQAQAGTNVTPAADVWAMGLIAFRCLAGKSFWRAAGDANSSAIMVLREMVMEPIPAASARAAELGCPVLPSGFDAWFAQCVERDASRRFQHARQAQEGLRQILSGGAHAITQHAPQTRPGSTALAQPMTNAFVPAAEANPAASQRRSTSAPAIVPMAPVSIPRKSSPGIYIGAGLAVLAIVGVVIAISMSGGDKKKSAKRNDDTAETAKPTFMDPIKKDPPKTFTHDGLEVTLTSQFQFGAKTRTPPFLDDATTPSVYVRTHPSAEGELETSVRVWKGEVDKREADLIVGPAARPIGAAEEGWFAYESLTELTVLRSKTVRGTSVACMAIFTFDRSKEVAPNQAPLVTWLKGLCDSAKPADEGDMGKPNADPVVSAQPTAAPSVEPTSQPNVAPTSQPSAAPVVTPRPTYVPPQSTRPTPTAPRVPPTNPPTATTPRKPPENPYPDL